MGLNLNFENVEEKSFELLPEGVYNIQMVKGEYNPPNGDKKPFINVEYDVVDPEFEGKKVWDRIYTTEKTMWRVKAWLEAITNAPVPPTMDLDIKELIGLTVKATITHRPYTAPDGTEKVALNVKSYAPADAGSGSNDSGFKML